ncbi:MAG: helix-turn-helix domain-containing protein [Oscillospiraceae bacterium]|nr:helix-turn-helix domain-containing protein [Oscillospiraceae bacterium]
MRQTIYDTIRKNIRKYRKEKGITSAQLTEMTGLSHDFIRQIQSDKTRYNFSVETFYKISVALDVSMDTLAGK